MPSLSILALPTNLRKQLNALLALDPHFATQQDLTTLFTGDTALVYLAALLPQVDNVKQRAERTVALLQNPAYAPATADPLLLTLLNVLVEEAAPGPGEPQSQLWSQLQALREAVRAELVRATGSPPLLPPPNTAQSTPQGTLVGEGPMYIRHYQIMLQKAQAVALIHTPHLDPAAPTTVIGTDSGTAWLLAPSLALTCWHVVYTTADPAFDRAQVDMARLQAQARASRLLFGFDQIATGRPYDVADVLAWSPAAELDYALLRLNDDPNYPLASWGLLKINPHPALTPDTGLAVLEYADTNALQEGEGPYRRVVDPSRQRIEHAAVTRGGASGGPVFDRSNWEVVALHQSGNRDPNAPLGQGTLLAAILADLQPQVPAEVYATIKTAQGW